MKIELTPFQQRQSYTPKDRGRLCVAACLRTVLAALSTQYSEDDLARACNTDPSGTTLADAAIAVRSLGFNALFIPETTFEMLTDWLQRGVPRLLILLLMNSTMARWAVMSSSFVALKRGKSSS